jgi:hypothetical protein
MPRRASIARQTSINEKVLVDIKQSACNSRLKETGCNRLSTPRPSISVYGARRAVNGLAVFLKKAFSTGWPTAFAYKTTEAQYNELKQCLRAIPSFPLVAEYCQVWLLFAAEWWKREYAGGAWRWARSASRPDNPACPMSKPVATLAGHRQWLLTTEIRGRANAILDMSPLTVAHSCVYSRPLKAACLVSYEWCLSKRLMQPTPG